ncbi:MAG: serine protease [Clostridia bacterium]|nr:serine protease [Clostridia bacterium]
MEKKQKTLSLLLAMMLGAGATAQAETPTAQFGPSGWPYRQPLPCQTEAPEAARTPVPDHQPVLTQVPQTTPKPTEAPVITQMPLPTHKPTATIAPTQTPDRLPTAMPEKTQTPKPTATATPQPVPTATPRPETSQKPVVTTPAPSTDDDYTTGYVTTQEEIAFLLLNQDRAANGMAPLQLDPALCSIARLKSQDMRDNRYFAHTSPTYGSASQMLKTLGYSFSAVGENIAHHATVEKSQAAFMSSAGHRKNILSTSWTKVGIGVVVDAQGFVYVTQLFVR